MDEDQDENMKFVCSIEAAIKSSVNADIAAAFPNSGPDTFSAPYSSDGVAPATHYVTSWRVSVAKKNALVAWLTTNYPGQFQWAYVEYINVDAAIASIGLVPLAAL